MSIFNTAIGQPAENEVYFDRAYLNNRALKYLERKANILVSAPRRVGKTSFLKNLCLLDNDKLLIKYHTTESINQIDEFYKKLYKSLLEEISLQKNVWEGLKDMLKRNKIEKIGLKGIELKHTQLNYFEEFKNLLKNITLDKKIVFIIDEFSETLENIIKDYGEKEGQLFLHQNRELRQESEISNTIQFIYSGSIGLGNIAERIEAIKSINDLTDFAIPPFSKEEAYLLIEQLLVDKSMTFSKNVKDHLLKKIVWLMPYYIQIVLDELEELLLQQNKKVIAKKDIDQALAYILDKRNYFEHWHTRLRTAFQGNRYTFAKEVLNLTCKEEKGLSKTVVFDLSEKYKLREGYLLIIRTLEYDGYIHLGSDGNYIFNSPLLQFWWKKNISI